MQAASNRFMDYESLITSMEKEMIEIQRVWGKGQRQQSKIDIKNTATSPVPLEKNHVSVQTTTETNSVEVQTDPYTCCLEKKKTLEVEVQTSLLKEEKTREQSTESQRTEVEEACSKKEGEQTEEPEKEENPMEEKKEEKVSLLRDQLNRALKLASERSSTLVKYELQIAEYQVKIDGLNKSLESKDLQLTEKEKLLEECKAQPRSQLQGSEYSDKLALKSTINSLQKLLSQKEETISRYQNLLKEDRDEHSKAAVRLQEEIRSLQARLQEKVQKISDEPERLSDKESDTKSNVVQTEEVARLQEKVSTLEADLNITKELSERWHRLAEERLKHMDRMRER